MTKLHETNDEQIKNLYNLGYRWYVWGVRNNYMEVMFKEALDYTSANALTRQSFNIAFDTFKYIIARFWNEEEQMFTVNVTELESACNYYSIMATSVNKIIYDKDFMLHFYCKHQDIARAMLSYKEITND